MPQIRQSLRGLGIAPGDVSDVAQDVALATWLAIEEGRFEPPPDVPMMTALRSYMHGIAVYRASRYRKRARREQLEGLMLDVEADTWDEDARLDARTELGAIGSVEEPRRSVVVLRAFGFEFKAIAEMFGAPLATTFNRAWLGRLHFAAVLRRWRR